MTPLVTVVIVSFNTKNLTISCLKSVYKHEKKSEIEILVVDNGSTDGSPEAISQEFPDVILLRNPDNLGFAKANNQAIRQAKGKYIFLLNSDTELLAPILEPLTTQFESLSNVGAIVPQLLNSDQSLQSSVFHLPTVWGAIQEFWLGQPYRYSKYIPANQSPAKIEAAVMAAMLIPKSVFDQVGLLSESYFMYYEDLEFCRRLAQHKLAIYYDPTIQVLHHHGKSGVPVPDAWKRLIPSSKRYHGNFVHYLIYFVLYSGQKLRKPPR